MIGMCKRVGIHIILLVHGRVRRSKTRTKRTLRAEMRTDVYTFRWRNLHVLIYGGANINTSRRLLNSPRCADCLRLDAFLAASIFTAAKLALKQSSWHAHQQLCSSQAEIIKQLGKLKVKQVGENYADVEN